MLGYVLIIMYNIVISVLNFLQLYDSTETITNRSQDSIIIYNVKDGEIMILNFGDFFYHNTHRWVLLDITIFCMGHCYGYGRFPALLLCTHTMLLVYTDAPKYIFLPCLSSHKTE